MNHYTYRAEWSCEHGEYVGRCLELPWLSRWAPTLQEATAAIEQAVDEFIAERTAAGEDLPRHSPTDAETLRKPWAAYAKRFV